MIVDKVLISPSPGVEPRMKLWLDNYYVSHSQVGWQACVNRTAQGLLSMAPLDIKCNHLSPRMNAGVCPSGANDPDRLLCHGRDSGLQRLLNRPLSLRLSLKAMKVSSIVFDSCAVSSDSHRMVFGSISAKPCSRTCSQPPPYR